MDDDGRASSNPRGLHKLARLVATGEVMILSGAGISTESGIPDYRGPTGSQRRYAPMLFQTFIADAAARRRYWARSHAGWRRFAQAAPNTGHRMVARLEGLGLVSGIVTQNVDGLHQAAGASVVTELHGNLARVVCLTCRARTSRHELDRRLRAANVGFSAAVGAINPDGDVEISDDQLDDFVVVECEQCGGVLKPDVVFFGENVPPSRVQECYELLDRSRLLLVLGSSLTVMSGYRFVRHAVKVGTPVAIVNCGATRGDEDATVTIDGQLGAVLSDLVALVATATTATTATTTTTTTARRDRIAM
jgi:NAD-dependent SIR2 family protein deacetylase